MIIDYINMRDYKYRLDLFYENDKQIIEKQKQQQLKEKAFAIQQQQLKEKVFAIQQQQLKEKVFAIQQKQEELRQKELIIAQQQEKIRKLEINKNVGNGVALAVEQPIAQVEDKLKECSICMDKEATAVIVPCGHTICYDGQCRNNIKVCPICRGPFSIIIKIHHS
jgi:hypothetical protein